MPIAAPARGGPVEVAAAEDLPQLVGVAIDMLFAAGPDRQVTLPRTGEVRAPGGVAAAAMVRASARARPPSQGGARGQRRGVELIEQRPDPVADPLA